jgi:hypothetical protein
MKKMNCLLPGLLLLLTGMFSGQLVTAQDAPTCFIVGKWQMYPQDLPMGEIKPVMVVEMVNDTLHATITEETVPLDIHVEKIEMEGDSAVKLSWWDDMDGTEIFMRISRAGEDSISGIIIDTYPLTGKRIRE